LLTFICFSSRTETEHGRSADENQPGVASKKFKGHAGDNDDYEDDSETIPAYSLKPVPEYYMFEWTNDDLRDCVNVVINLSSGSTAHADMSNVGVTIASDDKHSFLRLTYKWNESMVEVDKLYPFIKVADRDQNFFNCIAAHKKFLGTTFGLPGKKVIESTVCIQLPFKVRDVNPKIQPLKRDNGSRMLHISMESATEPKNLQLVSQAKFQNAD
jgi:hypothetical protein